MAVYTAKIYEIAKITLSDQIDAFGEDNFRVLLAVLLNSFDGAAIFSHVLSARGDRGAAYPAADVDDRRRHA